MQRSRRRAATSAGSTRNRPRPCVVADRLAIAPMQSPMATRSSMSLHAAAGLIVLTQPGVAAVGLGTPRGRAAGSSVDDLPRSATYPRPAVNEVSGGHDSRSGGDRQRNAGPGGEDRVDPPAVRVEHLGGSAASPSAPAPLATRATRLRPLAPGASCLPPVVPDGVTAAGASPRDRDRCAPGPRSQRRIALFRPAPLHGGARCRETRASMLHTDVKPFLTAVRPASA
jgi:hypothetical protein